MTKKLKLTASILAAFFLIAGTTAKAEMASKSPSVKTSKPKYSGAIKKSIYEKIDKANKDSKYDLYKNLTQEEKLARLEIMKEKYPIGWYYEMFKDSDPEDCNTPENLKEIKCNHGKLVYKLTESQLVSIFLHYDDKDNAYTSWEQMPVIVTIVLFATPNQSLFSNHSSYEKESVTKRELDDMIKRNTIIESYRKNNLWAIKENLKNYFSTDL